MSDSVFKVTAVHGSRNWSDGRFTDYTIELEGLEGRHTLTQKPQTPAPQVGQELFGHAEAGGQWPDGNPKPPKFKKAQQQQGGGGGNNNRAKDPAERESIERQVAAKCATDLLVGFMGTGWKPESVNALATQHTALAKQISKEIKETA